jgi:hypothetical protein
MSIQASTMTVFLSTLGGRHSGPQQMNEDLAFHEMELAAMPRPGLITRLAEALSRFLAPRDMVTGIRGISPRMMRDLGLDPITGLDASMPAAPVRIRERASRPVVLGGRAIAGV